MPEVSDGMIQIAIQVSGVCHTDLHAAEGDWPVKPNPPFIPGHKGVGYVSAVGKGVRHIKEGDRVGVPWLCTACGHCVHCLGGWGRRSRSTPGPKRTRRRRTGCVDHGGQRKGLAQAVGMMARGGTVALNGLPHGDFPLNIFGLVLNGITVRGSIVGARLDLRESLEFAADGKVNATVSSAPQAEVNQVFDRMRKGQIEGRIVLDLAA